MIHSFSLPYVRYLEKTNPREKFGFIPWTGMYGLNATYRHAAKMMEPISSIILVDMIQENEWEVK